MLKERETRREHMFFSSYIDLSGTKSNRESEGEKYVGYLLNLEKYN